MKKRFDPVEAAFSEKPTHGDKDFPTFRQRMDTFFVSAQYPVLSFDMWNKAIPDTMFDFRVQDIKWGPFKAALVLRSQTPFLGLPKKLERAFLYKRGIDPYTRRARRALNINETLVVLGNADFSSFMILQDVTQKGPINPSPDYLDRLADSFGKNRRNAEQEHGLKVVPNSLASKLFLAAAARASKMQSRVQRLRSSAKKVDDAFLLRCIEEDIGEEFENGLYFLETLSINHAAKVQTASRRPHNEANQLTGTAPAP